MRGCWGWGEETSGQNWIQSQTQCGQERIYHQGVGGAGGWKTTKREHPAEGWGEFGLKRPDRIFAIDAGQRNQTSSEQVEDEEPIGKWE